MCGIYLTNRSYSEKTIREKLDSISYRGPDYQGYAEANTLKLGHNRLSIIDLDPRSHQPMQIEGYSLVFNGEIYNYLEVKQQLEKQGISFHTTSDTEVLLKGYIAWGEKILDHINGMFAFAIYNESDNQVFVARDRLGVKPLYYSWNKGKLELASQLSPLTTNGELDEESIRMYLSTGYIPTPKSIYKDISKLPAGSYAKFDLNQLTKSITSYWELEEVKTRNIPYDQAKQELKALLQDAVKIRLQSDVSYGSFLSGGIDSALVSSMANEALSEPLKTFTIGFEDKKYDESDIAQQFADQIGSDHRITTCKSTDPLTLLDDFFKVYDEPFADSSALPSLLLNKVTKPFATVVLSGDGGDESFLGYNHFAWLKQVSLIYQIPYVMRIIMQKFFPFNWLGKRGESIKNIVGYKSLSKFIQHIFTGFDSITQDKRQSWSKSYQKYLQLATAPLQRAADLNIRLWLEGDSNVKVDRASMAYSVEVRSPFLDYRVVEYARSLPVHFRYKGNIRKRILRDILSAYIPEKIFNQPKKGFAVPLASWIRKELKEEITVYLKPEKLKAIPCLDHQKMELLIQKHFSEKADYSSYIWRVYVLSKWMHINKRTS